MCLRKFVAGVLSFVFLVLQVAVFDVFAQEALPYPTEGYCTKYKTTLNFDRTKVPNNPLSDYLHGLSNAEANVLLKEIKSDQLCMQIADTQRLIDKTTDATRRANFQKELESLEAQHSQLLEVLRVLSLQEEAQLKAYEILQSLIMKGDQRVIKNFADITARISAEMNAVFADTPLTISLTQRAREVETIIKQYADTSLADRYSIKSIIKSRVLSAYTSIRTELNSTAEEFLALIQSTLSTDMQKEKDSFFILAKNEWPKDFSSYIQAYNKLLDDRLANYQQKAEQLVDIALAPAKRLSRPLEYLFADGSLQTKNLSSIFSHSHLTAEISSDLKASLKDAIPRATATSLTNADGEFLDSLKSTLAELYLLSESSDVILLKTLSNTTATEKAIQAVESGDSLKGFIKNLDHTIEDSYSQSSKADPVSTEPQAEPKENGNENKKSAVLAESNAIKNQTGKDVIAKTKPAPPAVSEKKASDSNLVVQKFDLGDLAKATGVGTGVATKVKAPVYGKGTPYTFTMDTIGTSKIRTPDGAKYSSYLAKIYQTKNPDKKYVAFDYGYNKNTKTANFHFNQKKVFKTWGVENHQAIGKDIKITAKSKLLKPFVNTKSSNSLFNFAKGIKYLGVVGLVVGVVADTYNIFKAEDKPKEVARVAGGWAGSALGAQGGASIGASIGALGGPAGAIAGGIIGGLVGGTAGYLAGSGLAETAYDKGKKVLDNLKFW